MKAVRPRMSLGGSSPGFSLVEALIVVALMGILSGVVVAGTGLLGNARLRSSGTLVLSAVRLGVGRANSTGLPVRLVFDLDSQRLVLEEGSGRLLRAADKEDPAAGAAPVNEAEREATEYAKGVLEGPRVPKPRFTPVPDFSPDGKGEGRSFERGVRVRLVQTEHDVEPKSEGRAYLYFWPGGGTERAVIQLTREGDEDGLTVLVSPLTGRARVQRGLVGYEDTSADYDFGVLEEQ
jgi:general secretion pathway protein H